MRKFGFRIIFLLISTQALAQEIALIKSEQIPPQTHVIRKYAPGEFIVRLDTQASLYDQRTINTLPENWKYSQKFLKNQNNGEVGVAIRLLEFRVFDAGKYPELNVFRTMPEWNVILLKGMISDIKSAFDLDPNVVFIDSWNENLTVREESTIRNHDLTVNGINKAQVDYPFLFGSEINVSVKERSINPDDIDVIERVFSTTNTDPEVSQHATDMATLIGGLGNSFVTGLGVARDVKMTSTNFDLLFPESSTYFSDNLISIQNHSYGVDIENFYGLETQAFDKVMRDIPELVVIFSAGNAGLELSEDGNYTGIQGFASLTGNFKQSKNSLVVTALDKELNISEMNSSGPAYDGRIKPELSAFGGEGTSEAAALVSGASALLQSHYKSIHGKLPLSSTIKSLLIAGAIDTGPENIDFNTGYGNMDLPNSLKIIDDGQVFEGTLADNEVLSYSITVPENVNNLRIALAWTDPPANPEDFMALVNDLDMKLLSKGTSQAWEPWILNSYPHPDSLGQPADRGIDRLNNVELITLNLPEPGEYEIIVTPNGDIQNGSQTCSISILMDPLDQFQWIHPYGNQAIESGVEHVFRWSESLENPSGSLEINYGLDNWELLDPMVDLDQAFFNIDLKDTTAVTQLRMNVSDTSYYSDPFMVSPLMNLSVSVNCEGYFFLTWPSMKNALSYEVSGLTGKVVEPILATTDTFLVISKSLNPAINYAITPIFEENKRGLRSFAVNIEQQSAGCYINGFFVSLINEGTAQIILETGSTYNLSKVIFYKTESSGINKLAEIENPETLEFEIIDDNLKQGITSYQVALELISGEVIKSEELTIYSIGQKDVLLFPNPVKNKQELTVFTSEPDVFFEVMDGMGRSVFLNEIRGTLDSFILPDLKKGLYFFRVSNSTKVVDSGRFIIR